MEVNNQPIGEILSWSENLVKKAGDFIVESRKEMKITLYKDEADIATNIDENAEAIYLQAIQAKFPDHNILSEKKGFLDKKSRYTWVIDPLDGTKDYIRHIPLYGTCLLLEDNGNSILSVFRHPSSDETFSAAKGMGFFLNGKAMTVNSQDHLGKAMIYFHPPNLKTSDELYQTIWAKIPVLLKKVYRARGYPFENLLCGWIAAGRIEAHVYFGSIGPKWWDVAPGILMVEEAGGKVTDLRGNPICNRNLSEGVLATNGTQIHKDILKILQQGV